MKKKMCECGGCRKTATVRLRNGHWICEDCAKEIRRVKRYSKVRGFFKEVLFGHLSAGPGDKGFDLCTTVFVKL